MGHVRDIVEGFEERNVKLLGVITDEPELLRKYLTFHETPLQVLNDVAKEVIAAYGLLDDTGPPRGIISRPAYLVLDGSGVIRFLYLSEESSDFPEDAEIFAALDAARVD
jgi:peroxiredoxin